jgi:hypothetical protein
MFEPGAVGAATGGMCAGLAGLTLVAERLPGINKITNKLHTDRVQALLILTAAYGLVATPAGRWWHDAVNGVDGWASGLIGHWTGLVVTGVLALIVLLYLINDMVTRRVEMRTRLLAAALPVLAASIPGTVGAVVTSAVGYVAAVIGWAVAGMFGIGS